jgi:hypothetical protein
VKLFLGARGIPSDLPFDVRRLVGIEGVADTRRLSYGVQELLHGDLRGASLIQAESEARASPHQVYLGV